MQITTAGDNWVMKVVWPNHTINAQHPSHCYFFTIAKNVSNYVRIFRPPKHYIVFLDFSIHMEDTFVEKNYDYE